MKKRIILITIIGLFMLMLPLMAGAETVQSGSCGYNVYYSLDDTGLLVISGSGEITECPWRESTYINDIRKIKIKSGITGISAYLTFNDCVNVTSVSIPETVTRIGYWSFAGCTSLSEINIPDGVTSIEDCAFYNCQSLTEIAIPDSVISIGDWAFAGCGQLSEITMSERVTSIGERAFYGCSSLKSITVPEDIISIGDYAFEGCGKISSIIIPENISSIGQFAFDSFSGTIVFLGNAPAIDQTAFQNGRLFVVYPHDRSGWDTLIGNSYGAEWIDWQADNSEKAQPQAAAPKDPTESLVKGLSNNEFNHNYYWDHHLNTTNSYLVSDADGSWTRVEYIGEKVVIEQYSKEKELVWKKTLTPELPIWGGFYAGEDYNFFVYGQSNDEEDDEKEVVRVVRYDKNWNRIDSASTFGYGITTPFSSGTLDMVQGGDYLYIHTSRTMYTSPDGLRHQSNLTYKLYIPEMVFSFDSPSSPVYTSHSFNQIIYEDEGDLVTVDHGDAYPRGIVISRIEDDTEAPGFMYGTSVMLYPFSGETGDNNTGATLGGSAATDNRYIVTGKSIDQAKFGNTSRDNIYVVSVSKEDFSEDSVRFRWQTQYQEGNTLTLANPFLIGLTGDRLLLLWAEAANSYSSNNMLRYVFLDENGEEATEVYSMDGSLSDVEPVVSGNTVNWYVTNGSNMKFYSLDLSVAGLDLTGATQKISDFVQRCYSLILGRDADQDGLTNWTNQLKSKSLNASEIISEFINSAEYLNRNNENDTTVEILYNTMLGRPSDPEGKQNWVNSLDAGHNSNALINGFCGSQEFLAICDDYGIIAGSVPTGETLSGIKGFVSRCYIEALSRSSDEDGLQYWCNILENKEQTPQQVAAGFVYSDEMNAAGRITEDPDALLDSLYKLYLGREADDAGKEYWKQRIAEGLTLDELNYGFAYSSEFTGIVADYGLE